MILISFPTFFSIAAIICSAWGQANPIGFPLVMHEAITIVSAPLLTISAARVTAFFPGHHHKWLDQQLQCPLQCFQKLVFFVHHFKTSGSWAHILCLHTPD